MIIAGINANNLAFVVQGGLLTAGPAVMIYAAIGWGIDWAMATSRQTGI